ncbi:hypothetical protein [Mycolicibacterium iranicum]|uniref:Uncharacterized protein n=1 Tax=Mycolicibacterium iranicum TaxID=912594 RepID=A0ABT4HNS3_MYCIR|nr:hypothetical protein [Mycolicibacterium iranicum]MCZ0731877.1 hypothetical protein [Mycolicibacterium iranicum]
MATTATKTVALQHDPRCPETAAQRFEDCVQKAVAGAPPLTPEQRERITAIMRDGAR